jgi:peptidoglycan-associated lipoprotein
MANSTSRRLATIAFLSVIVMSGACNKSIQSDSGSHSFGSSKSATGERPIGDLAASPALSASAGGPTDDEMIVARAGSSGQRIEDLRQERLAASAAALQDVFFDFDRWTLTEQGRQSLGLNADWLRSNPDKKITIEGHCDDRGTSAYNMVLGEKRAGAIRAYLMDLGIKAERLQTVSYGKERPFCQERTEPCYQQNRRGHLAIRNR